MMSKIQHREAKRLLSILFEATKTHKLLTYTTAAKALGRNPKTDARMVAQICDLLDAAAVLAGIPSLALVMVREASGDINHQAWKGSKYRDAIIENSRRHQFTAAEIASIRSALEKLQGMGNRAAWRWVRKKIPREMRYAILTGANENSEGGTDAINDLGTDIPARLMVTVPQYARDPAVRAAVLQRAAGRCELCGKLGFLRADGSRYLESHHIMALAKDGSDRMTNVIALCPDDHREAHFGQRQKEIEQEMILIVRDIEAQRPLPLDSQPESQHGLPGQARQ
jgi:5-methylcytosine-specific restriction endonuclease McrA